MSFSHYYDVDIHPQKTFYTTEPTVGVELDYFPFKSKNLFFSTGLSFLRFANVFRVDGAPLFDYKEGFPKVKQHYHGFKMPIRVGERLNIGERTEIGVSFGIGLLFLARQPLSYGDRML